MFNRLPNIRTKLSLLVLLSSTLATIVTSLLLMSLWLWFRVETLQDDLETTAKALGDNCAAAIVFNVPSETRSILGALKNKPSISQAHLFLGPGTAFASYYRDESVEKRLNLPAGPYPKRWFSWHSSAVVSEIALDGATIGYFYLEDDLSEIRKSLVPLFVAIPIVQVLALLLAYVLMSRLQRLITAPILALSAAAKQVSLDKDYSVRVEKQSPDEIGTLTDAFNAMLAATEEHRKAVEASEAEYRGLLNHTPLPVIVHEQGVMLYLNPAAVDLFNADAPQALIGQSLLTFVCSEACAQSQEFFTDTADAPSKQKHLTFQLCVPGKKQVDIEGTSISLNFNGRPAQLIICVDVTARLKVEKQLAEHRHRLEELVDERTTELKDAQRQLIVQERLAILGKLTATVSHELRNPLGAISNSLYNLGAALALGEMAVVQESLKISERNIFRCDRIINELLDYSRDSVLDLQPVAIDDFMQDVISELSWPDGIRVATDLRADSVLTVDVERLRRAVINILINAQQALQDSLQSDKCVKVTAQKNQNTLEIIITDNGPGIPPALEKKIFEPLFSTKNFGVGLGMSIVKDIMNLHQGDVEVRNNIVANGGHFVLWLPAIKD